MRDASPRGVLSIENRFLSQLDDVFRAQQFKYPIDRRTTSGPITLEPDDRYASNCSRANAMSTRGMNKCPRSGQQPSTLPSARAAARPRLVAFNACRLPPLPTHPLEKSSLAHIWCTHIRFAFASRIRQLLSHIRAANAIDPFCSMAPVFPCNELCNT